MLVSVAVLVLVMLGDSVLVASVDAEEEVSALRRLLTKLLPAGLRSVLAGEAEGASTESVGATRTVVVVSPKDVVTVVVEA